MQTPIITLATLAYMLAAPGQAQQQPSTLQPAPTQSQTAPCANTPNLGNNVSFKTPNKWKRLLDKQRAKLEQTTGIDIDDPTRQIEQTINEKPAPCPAKTNAPAQTTPAQQAAPLGMAQDTSVTLRCNPVTPPSKDGGHQTTLTLPDPHDYAVRTPNEFEADSVVPDLAAKTPCYLVKVDPKTNKPFVQQ